MSIEVVAEPKCVGKRESVLLISLMLCAVKYLALGRNSNEIRKDRTPGLCFTSSGLHETRRTCMNGKTNGVARMQRSEIRDTVATPL